MRKYKPCKKCGGERSLMRNSGSYCSDLCRFDDKWVLDPISGCHRWIASTVRLKSGYAFGYFRTGAASSITTATLTTASRFSYLRAYGRIPDDWFVTHVDPRTDHLCVNAKHLTAQPPSEQREQIRKRSRLVCNYGHEYSTSNTRIRSDNGARACRACHADARSRSRKRIKSDEWLAS